MTTSEDLSSKARIRRAAMRVIAHKGPQGATVREIATASGQAPGLITHHFGGKQGLIDAVDDSVTELVRSYLMEVPLTGSLQQISAASDAAFRRAMDENPDVATYVASSLLQFHGTNQGLLERLTDLTLKNTRRIRTVGATTQHDERQSALKTLMRQCGRLVLQPISDQMWSRMMDKDGGPDGQEPKSPQVMVSLRLKDPAPH